MGKKRWKMEISESYVFLLNLYYQNFIVVITAIDIKIFLY